MIKELYRTFHDYNVIIETYGRLVRLLFGSTVGWTDWLSVGVDEGRRPVTSPLLPVCRQLLQQR